MFGCVFRWNRFWSSLENFTSQTGQSPSQSWSVINHIFYFNIIFDLFLFHNMFYGLRRGFVFNYNVNDFPSISNRDDRVVLSRSCNVRDYVFFPRLSLICKDWLQVAIRINLVCVVVIFPISKIQSLFHRSIRHEWQFFNVSFRTIWIIGCENLNKFFMWFNRSGFLRFIKILINSVFSWIAWK